MRRLISIGVAMIGVAAMAIPVAASTANTTGEQVSLFACPGLAADTAFYVQHGHRFDPNETEAIGKWTFELEVDGNLLPLSHIRVVEAIEPPDGPWPPDPGSFLSHTYVYNFPDGLSAGQHDLRGIWTDHDGNVGFDWTCTTDFS